MKWYKKPAENLESLPNKTRKVVEILKLNYRKKDDIEVLLPLISEIGFFKK